MLSSQSGGSRARTLTIKGIFSTGFLMIAALNVSGYCPTMCPVKKPALMRIPRHSPGCANTRLAALGFILHISAACTCDARLLKQHTSTARA